MSISTANVDVTDTETSLHAASAAAEEISIKPYGNTQIWVGPTGVTPANGYPVRGEFAFTTLAGDEIFGITDGPTVPVRVFVNTG